MKLLCPSKGRAGRVLLEKVLPPDKFTLVVPHNEQQDYEKHYPNTEVLATPKGTKGITGTRQWILDTFAKDHDIMMLDDDIDHVRRNFVEPSDEVSTVIDDPETVLGYIESTMDIARQMGTSLFGYTSLRNPLQYPAHRVFDCLGMLNGACMGFLKGFDFRYAPDIVTADDYYIALLYIYHNRYLFLDHRVAFMSRDNFISTGGVSDMRTTDNMKNDTLLLRKYFGDVIQLKTPTGLKSHVHEGERSIRFPY
jgi:hypothetical protein